MSISLLVENRHKLWVLMIVGVNFVHILNLPFMLFVFFLRLRMRTQVELSWVTGHTFHFAPQLTVLSQSIVYHEMTEVLFKALLSDLTR